MTDAEPIPPRIPDDGIDLYCLECGYNLRGLASDPRRCPECGHLNAMRDLELGVQSVSRRPRDVETEPSICVGTAALAVPAVVLSVMAICEAQTTRSDAEPAILCCGLPGLLALAGWFVSAAEFRGLCMGKQGWLATLMHYHFYGLSALALVLLDVWLGCRFIWALTNDRLQGWEYFVHLVPAGLMSISLLAFSWWAIAWSHRRARRALQTFQRGVLAQEPARKPAGDRGVP